MYHGKNMEEQPEGGFPREILGPKLKLPYNVPRPRQKEECQKKTRQKKFFYPKNHYKAYPTQSCQTQL